MFLKANGISTLKRGWCVQDFNFLTLGKPRCYLCEAYWETCKKKFSINEACEEAFIQLHNSANLISKQRGAR